MRIRPFKKFSKKKLTVNIELLFYFPLSIDKV